MNTYLGPDVLVKTLSVARQRKAGGPKWQYHPRSDHHSKVSCLLMGVDLLLASKSLRDSIQSGHIACGINHIMTDYRLKRQKALDLVFHRSSSMETSPAKRTFKDLLSAYGVELTAAQQSLVRGLPDVPVRSVQANAVYIAFEAKACMTEFGKARPRLYDELNSSHMTVHGDTEDAIAAGFVLINAAPTFISPVRNPEGIESHKLVVSIHKQPHDYASVVQKIRELQPRAKTTESGFDGIGIVLVECRNDGSPVTLVDAPDTLKGFEYSRMIERVAHLFETRFRQR